MPEVVLTGLMARWQDLILSRLEERILQPAPQSTAGFYKAKPGKVDALRTHAQRLKDSLQGTSLPTDKDAALARADWLELTEEATSLELRVPSVNHGIQDSAEWASATFAACNGIISQCRQASAKGRFSKIKRHVNSRFTDYLSSLDGTGKLSNFLRRAGHDGSRRITHQQAYTERGASTHNDDIHAVLQQVFRD